MTSYFHDRDQHILARIVNSIAEPKGVGSPQELASRIPRTSASGVSTSVLPDFARVRVRITASLAISMHQPRLRFGCGRVS